MPELIALLAAGAVLARICWTDFFYLKIYNSDVLLLGGVVAAYLLLVQPEDIWVRLALGAILFTVAVTFWLLGKLGAGDAKLLGVAGIRIPPDQAILFTVLLMAFALGFYLLCRKAEVLRYIPQMAGRRMVELIETRRVPYGIPIALATIALMAGTLGSRI